MFLFWTGDVFKTQLPKTTTTKQNKTKQKTNKQTSKKTTTKKQKQSKTTTTTEKAAADTLVSLLYVFGRHLWPVGHRPLGTYTSSSHMSLWWCWHAIVFQCFNSFQALCPDSQTPSRDQSSSSSSVFPARSLGFIIFGWNFVYVTVFCFVLFWFGLFCIVLLCFVFFCLFVCLFF